MDELALPDDEYIPPELLLDDTLPCNDDYLKKVKHLERALVHAQQPLNARELACVKARHRGLTLEEAAKEAGYAGIGSAQQAMARPKCQKVLHLLRFYAQAIEGPNIAQRINMLYRIANRNEQDDPRVSISAIDSINKMTHVYQTDDKSQTVNIQINGVAMPRTALDGD